MRSRALPSTIALLVCAVAATGCSGGSSKASPTASPRPSPSVTFHPVTADVVAAHKANLTATDFPKQDAWLATRLSPRASQDRLVLLCLKKKPLQDLTADVESSLYDHQLKTRGQAIAVIGEIAVTKSDAAAKADVKTLATSPAKKCLQQVLAKSLIEAVPRTVEAVGVVATPAKAPTAAGSDVAAYTITMRARSGNRARKLAEGEIVFYVAGRAVVTLNMLALGGASLQPSLTTSLIQAVHGRVTKALP